MPRKVPANNFSSASRIRSLQSFLHLTTEEFAAELGCSRAALVDWKRGAANPSSQVFISLGNLAGDPSCWFFWSCAGLYRRDLMRVLPPVRLNVIQNGEADLAIAHAGAGKHLFSHPLLHAIPILPVRVAAVGTEGDKIDDLRNVSASGCIASPSNWCPNPRFTNCLRVAGDSMAPLICDGYIIVVDTSQVENEKLDGELIVAWDATAGLVVARLKRNAGRESLVSANQEYSSLVTEPNKQFRIIGKVLWWVGREAPVKPAAA